MDNWTLAFSPGGDFCCSICKLPVDQGYVVGSHPNWPGQWMCLTHMLADVREHINRAAVS